MADVQVGDTVQVFDHANPPVAGNPGPYNGTVTATNGTGDDIRVNVGIDSGPGSPATRKNLPKSPPAAAGAGKYFVQS